MHNLPLFHKTILSYLDLFNWVPSPSLLVFTVLKRDECITVSGVALLACKYCSTLWSKIRLSNVKCITTNTGRLNYSLSLPRYIFWKSDGKSKLLKVWKNGKFCSLQCFLWPSFFLLLFLFFSSCSTFCPVFNQAVVRQSDCSSHAGGWEKMVQ